MSKPHSAGKKNVTLKVRVGALRVARELAAREGLSVSELFEQMAEERAGKEASRAAAARELIDLAEKGLSLGGGPYLSRDDAHER